MNKNKWAVALGCALILTVAVGIAADKAWFDLEGCDVCVKMSSQEGLMDHMQWENHVIENGMLSVTTVDPAYREKFERAEKGMAEMGAKMAGGEKLHLCGFCASMGELMMKGAKTETIKTATGQIMLVTSSDPKTAQAIRKHAQITIDEFAKMAAAGGEHHGDGHDHGKHAAHGGH